MQKNWFLPRSLALRFALDDVSNREAAYIVLSGLLLGSVVFYSGASWANPPWTLLSFYEFVVVVAVTIFGFSRCYEAAGADSNDNFFKEFACLGFPLWLWTNVFVWSVYWLGIWGFRQSVIATFNFQEMGLGRNLAAIGGTFNWLWTFLAAVALQAIFFGWMSRCFRYISDKRIAN